eukprot:COSAG02_NODE_43380_length_375_cov_0.938406_1_plen_73_part_00
MYSALVERECEGKIHLHDLHGVGAVVWVNGSADWRPESLLQIKLRNLLRPCGSASSGNLTIWALTLQSHRLV